MVKKLKIHPKHTTTTPCMATNGLSERSASQSGMKSSMKLIGFMHIPSNQRRFHADFIEIHKFQKPNNQ